MKLQHLGSNYGGWTIDIDSINDGDTIIDAGLGEDVSIKTLITDYNPSLIKLDIEGSEYEVLSDCVGVKQICVEFHHNQISTITINDTMDKINMLKNNGYTIIHTTPNYQEVTFLKK